MSLTLGDTRWSVLRAVGIMIPYWILKWVGKKQKSTDLKMFNLEDGRLHEAQNRVPASQVKEIQEFFLLALPLFCQFETMLKKKKKGLLKKDLQIVQSTDSQPVGHDPNRGCISDIYIKIRDTVMK